MLMQLMEKGEATRKEMALEREKLEQRHKEEMRARNAEIKVLYVLF